MVGGWWLEEGKEEGLFTIVLTETNEPWRLLCYLPSTQIRKASKGTLPTYL